jgi:hypothetical protein
VIVPSKDAYANPLPARSGLDAALFRLLYTQAHANQHEQE